MNKETLAVIADMVPSNWVDPLLTGPKAVIGKPPYNCNDIENLLNGVRDRIKNRPLNKEVEHEQATKCIMFNRCRYRELPDCNDQCRHKPPVG